MTVEEKSPRLIYKRKDRKWWKDCLSLSIILEYSRLTGKNHNNNKKKDQGENTTLIKSISLHYHKRTRGRKKMFNHNSTYSCSSVQHKTVQLLITKLNADASAQRTKISFSLWNFVFSVIEILNVSQVYKLITNNGLWFINY